jgi:DNA-binding transcriptional LysR family regulator
MDDSDFKPREIEVFAAIMMYGTTTQAAEALDMTQPAVSKALARFQKKAGFEVFRKHRQRLVPTQEAHMLYAEVQRTYESARLISRAARDIRSLRNGRLNICALPGVGLTVLPQIVAAFAETHPDVAVTIDIRASPTVIERASRNQIDLGIAVTSTIENPAVVHRALATTTAVCAMPKGHPLARLDVVRVEDLAGEDFISLGSTDPLRLQIDHLCQDKAVARNMQIECTLASACLKLVSEGVGISIIDNISAWSMRDGIEIRKFLPCLPIELSIYRPWGVIASAVTTAFVEHAVKSVRDVLKIVERHQVLAP